MKLSFDKNFDRKGKGWRLSRYEKGSPYSSFICQVDDMTSFISTTKKLGSKLDENKRIVRGNSLFDINFSDLTLVPLYNKTLVDLKKKNNKNNESFLLYIEAEKGLKIADVLLDGCGAVLTKFSHDKNKLALAVYTVKPKWGLRIIQENGKMITLDESGKIKNSRYNKKVPADKKIIVKRITFLPENTFFTRPDKDTKLIDAKDGFRSVSVAQALSKNSVILGSPKKISFDKSILTENDIELLTNLIMEHFKELNKNVKHKSKIKKYKII